MRKPPQRVVRIVLITLVVTWVVSVVAGFTIGYAAASHDPILLGGIGALAGAAIHMVFCWIVYAVLAARYRESREELSLWPHPPGSLGSWALVTPGMVFGVAAMIAFYDDAPVGVVIACLGVFSVLSVPGALRLRGEVPRRGKTPRIPDS